MHTPHDLVRTLARQSGVPLVLDADGWCMFEVDEHWIALRGTVDRLTIHGMIGAYPHRIDDAAFWHNALFRNAGLLASVGAALSLNDGHTVILSRPIACDTIDIESIGDISALFIDTVRELAAAMPMDDEDGASPSLSNKGFLPPFGGPMLTV